MLNNEHPSQTEALRNQRDAILVDMSTGVDKLGSLVNGPELKYYLRKMDGEAGYRLVVANNSPDRVVIGESSDSSPKIREMDIVKQGSPLFRGIFDAVVECVDNSDPNEPDGAVATIGRVAGTGEIMIVAPK